MSLSPLRLSCSLPCLDTDGEDTINQVKKRQFNEYPGQSLEPGYSGGDAQATYSVPRPFHLSNLRLQIRDGGEEYTATRVRKGPVSWDRRLRRFNWKRYALVPQLGGVEGDADKGWRELPWPKEEVPTSSPGKSRASLILSVVRFRL